VRTEVALPGGEQELESRLTEADSVSPLAMASIALRASDEHRPRETIDLAQAAQRIAGRSASPRLKSLLLAREAVGHAGMGDARSACAALGRARNREIDEATAIANQATVAATGLKSARVKRELHAVAQSLAAAA
jgi:hypothetical protein